MTESQKMSLESMDIVAEKCRQLKQLFPEVFVENKVDFDQLRRTLGEWVEPGKERFGLNWPGKAECLKIIQQPSVATLKPVRSESVNFDSTKNLFIEGDNLEVLKLLQKSYFGKIKMIYIDPPYNTGNEFIYPDNYSESLDTYLEYTQQKDENGKFSTNTDTNGRYHSRWLNMMYPRLYLARNLLCEDGAIFISIDDNEFSRLRDLCDNIFGEENHVGVITIRGNPSGRDYGGIARMHDYLLVYANSPETEINRLEDTNKKFPFEDERGGFETRELRNRNITFNKQNRPNLHYPFYLNPNKVDKHGFFEISLDKKTGWEKIWPKESQGVQTVWRWGKEKSGDNLNLEIVGKANKNGGYQIVEKYREKSRMARSIWHDKDVRTERGTLLVKKLFDGKVFDFPKPYEVLARIVEMGSDKDSIILDFFAGSATTAHAVMGMNYRDGGTRNFIMVQLPEPTERNSQAKKAGYETIADIGKERIRRVAKKTKEEQKGQLDINNASALDLGFKAFKLSHSNFKVWEGDIEKIDDLEQQLLDHVDHVSKLSTSEDMLYELLLKSGFPLTVKVDKFKLVGKEVFSIEDKEGKLLICLEKNLSQEIVDSMAEINPTQVICLDEGFNGNDQLKANAIQTFKLHAQKREKEIVFKTL